METPRLSTAITVLTALSLGCSKTDENDGVHFPPPPQATNPAGDLPGSTPGQVEVIDYHHPICQAVRVAKAELDAIDSPAAVSRGVKKGVRSIVRDESEGTLPDGTRRSSKSVASGSGTPVQVRHRADASMRFFDAARRAGGLEKAVAICLERRHVLSGKPPKGK